jgi:hypothetical protein
VRDPMPAICKLPYTGKRGGVRRSIKGSVPVSTLLRHVNQMADNDTVDATWHGLHAERHCIARSTTALMLVAFRKVLKAWNINPRNQTTFRT